MKIKDLKILSPYYSSGWSSGMEEFGPVSWGDWVLISIEGDKLTIQARDRIGKTGKIKEVVFLKLAYLKLTEAEKEKVDQIFQVNIGKTVEFILGLDFE